MKSSKNHKQILATARQKLLETNGLLLMRAVSYLRLSCSVLGEKGAYSNLMQALFEHDQNWIETCQVAAGGYLRSTDPKINQLLKATKALHQTPVMAQAA